MSDAQHINRIPLAAEAALRSPARRCKLFCRAARRWRWRRAAGRTQEIVPYVEMPERLTPGVPLRFASALPLAGYGRGVIVTSVEGRPIKIDGNPRHPASLGSTDVFAEAAVLSLYDPDRSQAPRSGGRHSIAGARSKRRC